MESKVIAKKLVSGSILRVALLACNMGVSFFMMPFLIHALGDRWYGFWTLVGAFMGYYGFLDLGLTSAVSRFVSRAYGQKNYDEMNTVINTSLALFSLAGLVALVISVVVALLCPYFIIDHDEAVLFRNVVLILGSSVAIGFPMRAFAGVLTSKIRYDLIAYVSFLKLFIRTSLIVYFFTRGYSILSLALITFFVEILGYMINFWLVKKEFIHLKLGREWIKAVRVKSLFNYSKYTFISQLADQIRFKIDSFVIVGFLNLSLVTHYFIAARLIEYFVQFIISAVGMLSPVFSQYEGRGDGDSIRRLFLDATRLSVILSVFVGTSLIIYGNVFIQRWMGPDFQDSYQILLILCVPIIFALIQNPSIGLLYGISKHRYYSYANSLEGIMNLILSLVLVRYYGIYGVALGTAIPMFLFKVIVQPIYVCRVIQISLYEYYIKTLGLTSIKTIIPILLFYYLTKNFLIPNYMVVFVIGLSQVVLFVPIAYFFILTKQQKYFIGRWIGIIR